MEGHWKLVVRAAVESASRLVFACAAPLLEEERHPLHAALATNLDDPISKHRPGVRAALAADDHPIDSVKIQRPEFGQQRFD